MRKLNFYSFEELSQMFHISTRTVRNWSSKGDFKVAGYKWISRGRRIALVSEKETKRLIYRKLIRPRDGYHID